jgi:hypothetical protein
MCFSATWIAAEAACVGAASRRDSMEHIAAGSRSRCENRPGPEAGTITNDCRYIHWLNAKYGHLGPHQAAA